MSKIEMAPISKDSPQITLVATQPTSTGRLHDPRQWSVFEFSKPILPTMGIPIIHAVLEQDGFTNVQSIDARYRKRGKLTKEDWAIIGSSDILGLTAISKTAPQTLELARTYHELNPRGTVVMGGPHATFTVDECLNLGADIIVRKEGEKTVSELMNRLMQGETPEGILGISYKKDGEIINEPFRPLLTPEELASFPLPIYDPAVSEKSSIEGYSTSRGCNNDCDFCSVNEFYDNKYRRLPNEGIVKNLEEIKKRNPNKPIFLVDDNFFVEKGRTKELLRMLEGTDLIPPGSFIQIRVEAAEDDEFLELLQRSNISGVYLGVESVSDDVLKLMNKKLTREQMDADVGKFRKAGLWVHGMFILGADGDTKSKIRETVSWAKDNVHSAQFFAPVPLPGTRQTAALEKENRIITKKYNYYDGLYVTIEPQNLSPWQLQQEIKRAYTDFYSLGNWGNLILRDAFSDQSSFSFAEKVKTLFSKTSPQQEFIKRNLRFIEGARLIAAYMTLFEKGSKDYFNELQQFRPGQKI